MHFLKYEIKWKTVKQKQNEITKGIQGTEHFIDVSRIVSFSLNECHYGLRFNETQKFRSIAY